MQRAHVPKEKANTILYENRRSAEETPIFSVMCLLEHERDTLLKHFHDRRSLFICNKKEINFFWINILSLEK